MIEVLATAITGLAVSGGLVGLVIILVLRNSGITDRLIEGITAIAAARGQNADLARAVADRDTALVVVKAACEAEKRARQTAEGHRDELLHELARVGDPAAIAAAIREQLRKVSDLSRAGAGAAEGGGREAAVHGGVAADGGAPLARPER